MESNEDSINVGKSSIKADYPVGQRLTVNGINCIVTKRGYCPDCVVGTPNTHCNDNEITCKDLACLASERKDGTSVHFKEI